MDSRVIETLDRIAIALEMIAAKTPPEIERRMEEFAEFKWASINAEALHRDEVGPTCVLWGCKLWFRASNQGTISYLRNSYDRRTTECLIEFISGDEPPEPSIERVPEA